MKKKEFIESCVKMGYEVKEFDDYRGFHRISLRKIDDKIGLSIKEANLKYIIEDIEDEKDIEDFLSEHLTDERYETVNNMTAVFTDKEKFLDNVYPVLLPKINDLSDNVICEKGSIATDLYVIYKVCLGDLEDQGFCTAAVKKDMLDNLNISQAELKERAVENFKKGVKITSMTDLLRSIRSDIDLPIDEGIPQMIVVNQKVSGAYGIEDVDTLDKVCNMLHTENILLIPSSIYEFIAVPGELDEDAINMMVHDVNRSQVSPDEQLSDHVYKYEKLLYKHGRCPYEDETVCLGDDCKECEINKSNIV